MKYLSLDSQTFMSVRSFVHHVIYSGSMDPGMQAMFIFNDALITSTMNLNATRLLYSYVTDHVIPEAVCDEMSWNKKRSSSPTYWVADRKPLMLYLPAGDDSGEEADLLHLRWTKRDVFSYRSVNGATLVIVFDSLDAPSVEAKREAERKSLLDSVDLYSKQHLFNLTVTVSQASVIALRASSLPSSNIPDRQLFFHNPVSPVSASATDLDSSLSILYYNEANGALKTFLPTPSIQRQSSSSLLQSVSTSQSVDTMSRWMDLESDFRAVYQSFQEVVGTRGTENQDGESAVRRLRRKDAEGVTEVLGKTDVDEHWLCFRRCDQRSFFANLAAHKNQSLEEVAAILSNKAPPNGKGSSHLFPFASLFQ